MSEPTIDSYRPLKDALGRFATGIALASCYDANGAAVMITINSFTSVSLEPPLVLWCIEKRASTFATFTGADSYGISILNADQKALSDRFSGYAPAALGAGEWERAKTTAPLLKNCLAALDCRVVERHSAGDHVILIGQVVAFRIEAGAPLVYFASQYATGPHAEI